MIIDEIGARDRSEGGPLAGARVRATGLRGRLGAAVARALVEHGARVDEVDVAEAGACDLVLHLAGMRPESRTPFDDVVRELDGVARARGAADAARAALVVVSTLEVRGARAGVLSEALATTLPYPAAESGARRPFSPESERAFLDDERARAARRAAHADVRSRLLAEARAHLAARKEPVSGRALDDEVRARVDAFTRALLDESVSARARSFGFASPFGYAKALVEGAASTEWPMAARALRVARLARVLDDEGRAAVRAALGDGALDDDDVIDVVSPSFAVSAIVHACVAARLAFGGPVLHATHAHGARALTVLRARDALDLAARARAPSSTTARAPSSTRALARALSGLARRAAEEARTTVAREWARARPAADVTSSTTARAFVLTKGTPVQATALARVERRAALARVPAIPAWREALAPAAPVVVDDGAPRALLHGPPREDALRPYDTLVHLFTSVTARYARRPVFTRLSKGDARELTYGELAAAARAAAARLRAAGVVVGDRVILSGQNAPEWPIAFFGVLLAGGTPVPVDPALTEEQLALIAKKARPRVAIFDKNARARFDALARDDDARPHGSPRLEVRDMALLATSGPSGPSSTSSTSSTSSKGDDDFAPHAPAPDDVASILFTSGTTGEPKGVMLTHANFCSLAASLGSIFDMHGDDRALSLLPLHHTLEFSCGLVMPLVAGAHVFYLDELTPERVLHALQTARITGMVCVPALWQALERKMRSTVKERGGPLAQAFDVAMDAQRRFAQATGSDALKLVFKPLHDALGGHLKILFSGGAALPKETHALFQGIGLPIAEGYGLTETAPVLTIAEAGPDDPGGTVGRPIPGVTIRIDAPDAAGAGEIQARGPNVMKGYFENDAATRAAFTDDGWLKTGDLGRIDASGRLVIVGRAKDVVVTASGENIYLDDVEALLGPIAGVAEHVLVGISAPKGGERLALVARPNDDVSDDEAKERVRRATSALVVTFRPAVVEIVRDALPRTATRKVKRKDVRARIEAILDERAANARDTVDEAPPVLVVRQAIAALVGRDVHALRGALSLEGDLGFDSLYWVELAALLAPHTGTTDPERLYAAATVAGVEALVRAHDPSKAKPPVEPPRDIDVDDGRLHVPAAVRAPVRRALTTAQRDLYDTIFSTTVVGRAHIPWNTPSIVVANHTSHLDTGLVKFALGRYGASLRPLAAKDYFFEGNPLKVAFFESFTNLVPLDRESAAGRAFEQALDVVRAGSTVLLYPEGTRRTDGTLGEFKPLVGRLALSAGVPVLPVFLRGAFDALPKGARFPRARTLSATIGAPIWPADLRAVTTGENAVVDARHATTLIRDRLRALGEARAIASLDDGRAREERASS